MRHASDALLTGIGTILADNPVLTDRSGLPRRRRLLRVILDSKLSLPHRSRVVHTADGDLLVFTKEAANSRRAQVLQKAGVEVVRVSSRAGRINLESVLAELGRREILNGAAIAAGIVHKLYLFYAPKISGESRVPFAIAPNLKLPPLQKVRTQAFGPDIAIAGYLQDVYR
jgi:diaminohydroxyphosphoribosylaminopyrimidine deaminase/5-amino-6-(5-phosphoribosylamino)uracil reductase